MKIITVNDVKYEVINNVRNGLDEEILEEKITDYFDEYDYIVGDWAYGKLRLKGFCEPTNKNCKKYNDITELDDYITNRCAYDCRWFALKKKSN